MVVGGGVTSLDRGRVRRSPGACGEGDHRLAGRARHHSGWRRGAVSCWSRPTWRRARSQRASCSPRSVRRSSPVGDRTQAAAVAASTTLQYSALRALRPRLPSSAQPPRARPFRPGAGAVRVIAGASPRRRRSPSIPAFGEEMGRESICCLCPRRPGEGAGSQEKSLSVATGGHSAHTPHLWLREPSKVPDSLR